MKRKPTDPRLKKTKAALIRELDVLADLADAQQSRLREASKELEVKDHQIRSRRDPLLDQRIQLANSLGQMVDAVSHAIKFIVGKEAL